MNAQASTQREAGPPRGAEGIGTLLGVWAHPDDEAYLSAGLMAVAREGGQRVVVATATKGELGTDDPVEFPPERLAPIRESEAIASLAAVGVTEHRWLGHRDGTLERIPAVRGVRQLTQLIEQVRPDTIVTFGPDGMTGHPDHRTISAWTRAAWHVMGRPGRLWYATVTPQFHQEWGAVHEDIGLWMPGCTPPSDPAEDLAFTVRCEGELLDRKLVALRAHASQTTGLINLLGPDRYRRWWSTEWFVDAARREMRSDAA